MSSMPSGNDPYIFSKACLQASLFVEFSTFFMLSILSYTEALPELPL